MSLKSTVQSVYNWFVKASGFGDDTSEVIPSSPIDFSYEGMSHLNNYFRIQQERKVTFRDLDTIDLMSPEANRALDIYADNSIYGHTADKGYTVDVTEGDSDEVQACFREFEDKSGIRDELWSIARNITKNGEDFWELICSSDGLVKIKYLPANTMWVDIDAYGRPVDPTKYFVQRNESDKVVASWPIGSVVHFKLKGDLRTPYGRSLLFSARRLFRQIHMMEDSMVIARARRAHARYIFNVDTGNLQQEQKLVALDNYKKRNMTRRMMDPQTGNVRTEDVPLRVEEDIFIGKEDKVGLLQGDISVTHISDVQYFLGKMYTALGVPKAFMARDETVNAKATLTQQDIQFARSVKRVQLAMRAGLKQIYRYALVAKGIDPDTVKFEIIFPQMNVIDVLMTWEIYQVKALVAGILRDDLQMFPTDWIYDKVFELTAAEVGWIKQLLEQEKAERMQELINSPLLTPSGPTDAEGKPIQASKLVSQGISRKGAPSVFPKNIKMPDIQLMLPRTIPRSVGNEPNPTTASAIEGTDAKNFKALRESLRDSPETVEFLEKLSGLLDAKMDKLYKDE